MLPRSWRGRMRGASRSGSSDSGSSSNSTPGDLDVVARLEALGLERPDHPDPAQAPLEVGQRVVVVEVVARHEPLDPLRR